MATVALEQSAGSIAAQIFKKPFAFLGKVMVAAAESSTRMQRINKLNAMSDEDLAKKGMTREDIVRYVYADMMCV